MPTYRLLLEYDGTGFVGWQRQTSGTSIQGLVEQAVASVMGLPNVAVMASGRTDAGVHALGQVASFTVPVAREGAALQRGLNSLLPAQVSCQCAARVRDGFDARKHAVTKRYRYRILDGDLRAATRQRFLAYERWPLDVDAMAAGAAFMVGTHDFRSFRAAGSSVPTSTRTIHELTVARRGDELWIEVSGDGFLRHMVRIMVGTLLEVGRGRMAPEEVQTIVGARDRERAGRTAAPRGLTLVEVDYGGVDAPLEAPGAG